MNRFFLAIIVLLLPLVIPAVVPGGIVPQRSVLQNGMILLTSEQKALPMVTINLLIDAGSRLEAPGKSGLANLTSRLLTYGTTRKSALEISETLDFIGANLSADCDQDVASVSLTILKKDLSVGLELLAEILTGSSFPEQEIERQKQSVIATIRAREEDPGDVAQRRFLAALYPDNPYGRPVEGEEDTVNKIERIELRTFFQRYYRPNRTIAAVVGDISHQEITQALSKAFRSWDPGEPTKESPSPPATGRVRTIRVEKELTQANIVLGHEGVPRGHPDYYAIQVMNYILGGGGFSSRAMDSIRNERGLAYSVYSYFSAEKSFGTFQFVMQTKNETAHEAIRLATEEVERIRTQPVGEKELSAAKDYLTGSFPLRLDTNRKVAAFLAQVEFFRLGLEYPDLYPELIRKVSRNDVLRVAQQYLNPKNFVVVIVGNQKKIGEKG